MFFLALLAIAAAEIFILDKKSKEGLRMELDVIERRICKGFFKPLGGENCTFKASIKSDADNILFSNDSLQRETETHFSFSTVRNELLAMIVTPVVIDEKKPHTLPEIEIKFESQFNTFDRDVAKKVSVEPAMLAMTKLDNLLLELNGETEYLAHNMGRIDYEHRKLFSYLTFLSLAILVVYFCVNVYEVYLLKRFFKMKKMI
jgi:p24 family protein delta-1